MGSGQGGGSAVTLIEPKRANNIAIILSRVRLPFDELRAAILSFDKETLSPDSISALLSCIPTSEEVEIVANAGVPSSSLGFAERFIAEIGSIPRLQKRLECLSYMVRFDSLLAAASADVASVRVACEILVSSAPLRQLLAVVLKMGNTLNGGSFRGAADGFRTDALTRLAELRTSTSPPSTLLHVAISHCASLPPPVSPEGEDEEWEGAAQPDGWARMEQLCHTLTGVRPVAKLSMTEIADEVTKFCAALQTLKDEVATASRSTRSAAASAWDGDRFVEVMGPFISQAEPLVTQLKDSLKKMQAELDSTHAFFAEDSKTSMETFFSRWATFITQLEAAVASEIEQKPKRARRF